MYSTTYFSVDDSEKNEEPWNQFPGFHKRNQERQFTQSAQTVKQILNDQQSKNTIEQIWTSIMAILYKPLQSVTFDGSWKASDPKRKIWLKEDHKEQLINDVTQLRTFGIENLVLDWYLDAIEKFLQEIAPRFWSHFREKHSRMKKLKFFLELQYYIESMELTLSFLISQINPSRKFLIDRFKSLYQAILFVSSSSNSAPLYEVLHLYFTQQFLIYSGEPDADPEADDSISEEVEEASLSFEEFCVELHKLNVISISETIFTQILFKQIERKIQNLCAGNFTETYLDQILEWMNTVVYKWLQSVICPEVMIQELSIHKSTFLQWKARLEFFVYEQFASLRISELFDIIIDFPESTPALTDLQTCLKHTNQHPELVRSLKKSFTERLLHPGANTSDIITQYISTIKALRLIDPSDVTLDRVSEPIRTYLRSREDTIRCIVSSCTEDPNSELFEELSNSESGITLDDDIEEVVDENWEPDPIDADPSTRSKRKQDIISILVNIYGSSEVFVNEYRNMLADRLMSITDYDTEKEVRILELLKLKFGEANLHNCEIMIRDISESKRINNNCKKATIENPSNTEDFGIDAHIVSYLFWPTFREEKINLPKQITDKLEQYSKAYENLKPSRQLNWKPHLGTVDLELEFNDKKLNFSVSPLQATVIMHFQEKDTWILSELASVIGISSDSLRKRIIFWVNNGIIKEVEKNVFKLVETPIEGAEDVGGVEEDEQSVASAQEQQEEVLKVYENFIFGMCKTFGQMGSDKIHGMLKNFVETYNFTIQQLNEFLNRLVKEDKLEFVAGQYALKK